MRFAVVIAALLAATPTYALTRSEIDDALTAVDVSTMRECVEALGDRLVFDTEVRDLNGDGIDEVVAFSGSSGKSVCFGQSGRDVHLLIRDDAGRWQSSFGFDAHSLRYIDRTGSDWPDIEIGGPGFCFPIWRYQDGAYGIWKTCEDGELVFAEGIRDGAVPSGKASRTKGSADSTPNDVVSLRNLVGMAFDHNGSDVLVVADKGLIVYRRPKSSIAGIVKPGTVLFRAAPWDSAATGPLKGIAYVFKKGCAPAPYEVRGRFDADEFTLTGASPMRAKASCAVTGKSASSANASLRFVGTWGDE